MPRLRILREAGEELDAAAASLERERPGYAALSTMDPAPKQEAREPSNRWCHADVHGRLALIAQGIVVGV